MSRAKDLRNITATGTAGEDNYVLTYDDATKKVSLEVAAGGDVVDDTSPQLGGNLDLNSRDITGTGNIDITGTLDVSGDAQFSLLKVSNAGGNQMVINNVYSAGIQIRGNWLRLQDASGATDMIIAKPGNEVELYYNGNRKLETTNTGISVTGTIEGASDAEIKTSPIRIHSNTISTNTTVASSENAVSGGPVTIANGVTVTVSGDWTVV